MDKPADYVTLAAVLHQMTNGEASDLIDDDQSPNADAQRDLKWCRDQIAAVLAGHPDDVACPECERSHGPNYTGPCTH